MTKLLQNGAKLSLKQADRLNVVTTVYEQPRLMFESRNHSIPRRIVSLAQPWTIVRGKAHANTGSGAKLHVSLVDGYAKIERLDFEPYNELEDIWKAIARYRERYGRYPERIWADTIYRNRQTLALCKEHGIRLSGPALGKPPKNQNVSRLAKKQEYHDSVTVTRWKVSLEWAGPLMVWPASWRACGKPHVASSALPSCP